MKLIRQTVFGQEEVEITKTCSVCEDVLSIEDFGLRIGKEHSYKDTDGDNQGQRRNECKKCKQEQNTVIRKLRIFDTKNLFDLIRFKKYIHGEKNNNDEINFYLNNLYPSLLISYHRKYFIYNNIRITLDAELKFASLAKINFLSKKNLLCVNKRKIIELKYSDEFQFQAAKITKMFNSRLDKFSKYQIGLLESFSR